MTNPTAWRAIRDTALECLRRWAPFSEQYWAWPPGRAGLGCFGAGYNSWGVQTNQKYLAAMAVLATEDGDDARFPREKALDRALAALRFSLASHHTGDAACTDSTKWGRTWISPLGIERMMHGVERLEGRLSPDDRRRLRELLADEADHQLRQPVQAGLWAEAGHNKPESNLWNGAVCMRAALAAPDDPRAAAWTEHAHRLFLSGISVPADATDRTVVAGRTVAERHAGANFFAHYALDHHRYLNVGYKVICLSQVALLHYTFRRLGRAAPESLYHHARDLWGLVRRLVFDDGRLIRIGGDTRIRFCYCQDYLLPTLIFAADHWGDPLAGARLGGAVEIIGREQDVSGDGRFLCRRLDELRRTNPYYYTRLESDRAVVLSLAVDWMGRAGAGGVTASRERERADSGVDDQAFRSLPVAASRPVASDGCETTPAPALALELDGLWCEPEHGAVFHRGPARVASWSWRAAEGPQGLCLPPADGDLAEWQENLAGAVRFVGERGPRELARCAIHAFDGGFVTAGEVIDGRRIELAEGWKGENACRHGLVFAALPDGRTALRMELARLAPRRHLLEACWGVGMRVPNDVFLKRPSRRYAAESGARTLPPHEGPAETIDLASNWVCVEGAIGLVGVYGADSWHVLRSGRRGGGSACGNILSDVLCWGLRTEPWDAFGPAVVLDNACLIVSSAGEDQTRELARNACCRPLAVRSAGAGEVALCRAVRALGRDGREYVLAANFGDELARVTLDAPTGRWLDLAAERPDDRADDPAGAAELSIAIAPGDARLFVAR